MNLFKKKQNPSTLETTQVCPTNQEKAECSLVQELRDIQERLKQKNDLDIKRYDIMHKLFKKERCHNPYMSISYDKPIGILSQIEEKGYQYTDIKEITKAIDLLQQYKDLTQQKLEYEQQKETLKQREKEIKELLGIN